MNKFEILAWGLLISFFTAAISGAVVWWWLARKELDEKGAAMKATKLIRDKGLQYAKEIVDSAPDNATE
ncbi:hypothetical protein KAB08_00936 [Acinetobacter baumannii]|nr:hypothetical protein KAB08_00936 [Acinetobacter baumannii]